MAVEWRSKISVYGECSGTVNDDEVDVSVAKTLKQSVAVDHGIAGQAQVEACALRFFNWM